MNWFETVFAALVPHGESLFGIWRVLALAWLAQTLVLLAGITAMRWRALAAGLGYGTWTLAMPENPLVFLGAGGRVAGLLDDTLLVLAMIGAGLFGLALSARRPDPGRTGNAASLAVMGGLAMLYHMVLINGVDGVQRQVASRELAGFLSMSRTTLTEICEQPGYWCGSGSPRTGMAHLDAELSDWFDEAEAAGAPDGTLMAGSNGAIGAEPTFVWAAEIRGNEPVWIARSYQANTDALEAGFLLMMVLASLFWIGTALLVERGHARAFRRRAQSSQSRSRRAQSS